MSKQVLANVTGVAIGGRALLIEGAPGVGKSSLALALIDRGAVLIGDDAIELVVQDGALIAAPPPNTSGLIEVRNIGLVELPTARAPVALVLKLDPDAPRFPMEVPTTVMADIFVPLLPFAPGDATQALRAEHALAKHGLPFPSAAQAATRQVQ
ncbi:HPr kinase/phosphatase C-terminal domain-containing protein [Qipengyuania sp. G39]|uniref:HPr kinase/phosphatase C-terminal domain-containing protein n=1 Tax=Qipengyuania profundimaris TaxID=3067652 RepID=A0ABT9HNC3_9SPHN|nr:HPr kinase/phosphatase C-terminal domain-containing protein [Qipengyuania sp. G39]MDP4574631.1 HPr kinase/phosphatase C-terminal domain-containing protein [Qipengyuania sp. G39]